MTYHVTWELDLEDEEVASVQDAAEQALDIHRDPDSFATVFVVEHEGRRYRVDLARFDDLVAVTEIT